MTPERWQQVEAVYVAVVARPASERAGVMADLCAGDETLRHDVESLLAHAGAASAFLETPVLAAAGAVGAPPLVGRRFGSYLVRSPLGAGGMGEVYRAHDDHLGRDVAIKILPPLFSSDPERLARFEGEARILAALNHPHIGAIYGLEHVDGIPALVLELVEGETLAERIARGPLSLSDALTIARQIAEALEAAHERGIIHRDLKPANIKITPDGVVKVLDFGLAKLGTREGSGTGPDLTNSPTMIGGTHEGVILGTAAYMSPEQARGQAVDKRTDVWAFGCVLFEMLTGRKAFAGETLTDTLAAILEREPPWTMLPDAAPAGVRRVLQRCLEKESKRRLRDIGDARLEIEESRSGAQPELSVPQAASRLRERLAWVSALALVMLVAIATGIWAFRAAPPAPEVRFDIATPPTRNLSMAMAPDGQKLVFVATSENGPRLWVHSLASGSAKPLTGTEGASFPFWSPDSRSVGFFAQDRLKRIDIGGGAAQVVAIAQGVWGGTWNRGDTILFGMGTGEPIFRVSAAGGQPVAVTPSGQRGQKVSPEFLPDGRHFLYHIRNGPEDGVYVGQIEGGETRRLFAADSPARYTSSGQLLFIRQDTLFAQNFDPVRLEVTGNAYPVAAHAQSGAVSASAAGPIAYRPGSELGGGPRHLFWFDRSGQEIENAGDPVHSGWANPQLSHDGRRVALWRTERGNADVWLFDLRRRVLSPFTFDTAMDVDPVWSPDGTRIVFSSTRKGVHALYQKSVTGAGSEEPLLATTQVLAAQDWSRDGRFLLYTSVDPKTRHDTWALPMEGEPAEGRKPFPVVQTNANEGHGQFSPDGKWIAFQSDESGLDEIYVQPFPGPGVKSLISTKGGVQVRWRNDGKELFYLALDGRLMAVPIQLASQAPIHEAGAPVPLFLTRVFAVQGANIRQQYMPSPDGQRFLVDSVTEPVESPITVILNWTPRP